MKTSLVVLFALFSSPLLSCELTGRTDNSSKTFSEDDLQWTVKSLHYWLNRDAAYIAMTEFPSGVFKTKTETDTKDFTGKYQTESSTFSILKALDGSLEIKKEYSLHRGGKVEAYTMENSTTYTWLPETEFIAGPGRLSFQSTMQVKNPKDQTRFFTIDAENLEPSSCGIQSGVVKLSSANESYLISYSGCDEYLVFVEGKKKTASR